LFRKKEKKLVLLVDNFDQARDITKTYLETSDYKVIAVSNAIDAMAQLEKKLPNLIISEIELPGQGSISFYNQLKTQKKTRFIPFIFYARKDNERLEEGVKKFQDIVISKNLKWKEVSEIIETFLAKRAVLKAKSFRVSKQKASRPQGVQSRPQGVQSRPQEMQPRRPMQPSQNVQSPTLKQQEVTRQTAKQGTISQETISKVASSQVKTQDKVASSQVKTQDMVKPLAQTQKNVMPRHLPRQQVATKQIVKKQVEQTEAELEKTVYEPKEIVLHAPLPSTRRKKRKIHMEFPIEPGESTRGFLIPPSNLEAELRNDFHFSNFLHKKYDVLTFEPLVIPNTGLREKIRFEIESEESLSDHDFILDLEEDTDVFVQEEKKSEQDESKKSHYLDDIEDILVSLDDEREDAQKAIEIPEDEQKIADDETLDEETDDETLDEETDDETLDEEADDETSDEEADDETSDKEADDETSDEEADDETSDKEADDETLDEETEDETSDKEADDETSDEEADDETSDKEADDETLDEEADDETSDKEAEDETSDEEADDETLDEEADDETSDEEADIETSDEEAEDETSDEEADDETLDEEADDKTLDEEVDDETLDEEATDKEETVVKSKEEIATEKEAIKETDDKEEAEDKTADDEETATEKTAGKETAAKEAKEETAEKIVVEKVQAGATSVAPIPKISSHSIAMEEEEDLLKTKLIYYNKEEDQWIQEMDHSFQKQEFAIWGYSAFSMASLCFKIMKMNHVVKNIKLETLENQIVLTKIDEKHIYSASVVPNEL